MGKSERHQTQRRGQSMCVREAHPVCAPENTSTDLLDGEAVSPKAWTLRTPNTFA